MATINLEYIEIDGLLYSNIQLDDEKLYGELGKYGDLRLVYLHEVKSGRYRELLVTGKLAQHCADIEQRAFELSERVRSQYLTAYPVPEEGMERIQAFTQAQIVADEIVKAELIYV